MGTVNDEREQTLNQLLVEMDGFEANVGVILLAATNRPEVLDRALLRPGRFDRQVIVDAPDLDGREAILKVHVRGIPLAPGVDLRRIAQGTPGFSGADLANAINEAALAAARRGGHEVTQRDLEEAVEKVVAGPERKSRRLNDEEKRRVAYHETGHALVGAYSKYADPVQKISIVPRGRAALGYTLQTPSGDQFLLTRVRAHRSHQRDARRPRRGRHLLRRDQHRRGKRSRSCHGAGPPDDLHVWHERLDRAGALRGAARDVSGPRWHDPARLQRSHRQQDR